LFKKEIELMAYVDLISSIHKKTSRNYLERVTSHDKEKCAAEAKKFGKNYWDGDRKFGFGGYYYDGRWKPVAQDIINHYHLKKGDRVLDIGCGKAFLLYELSQLIPGLEVAGIDISSYALEKAKEEIKPFLKKGHARQLPFDDNSFDLVLSINTLHNLYIYDLEKAIKEISRVSENDAYIVVESYRNEKEKANLLYWQLTCEGFYTPEEWEWLFTKFGYSKDHSFIFFG